jgi:hypothetical protein
LALSTLCFLQGTQNTEAMAGTVACIDYLTSLGVRIGSTPGADGRYPSKHALITPLNTAPPWNARTHANARHRTHTHAHRTHVTSRTSRRELLVAGMQAIKEHETKLKLRFLTGAAAIKGLRVRRSHSITQHWDSLTKHWGSSTQHWGSFTQHHTALRHYHTTSTSAGAWHHRAFSCR